MIDQLREENTLLIQEHTNKIDNLKTHNNRLIQENTKKIDKLKADNTLLIQENTRKIEKMKSDNTPLIQNINDQISQLKTDVDNIKNDQISQLRVDVDNIKTEQSSLPRLVNQLRRQMLSLILNPPGKWDVINSSVQVFCVIDHHPQLPCWSASKSATLTTTLTRRLLSTREDFQPMVSCNKTGHLENFLPGEIWIGLDELHRLTSKRSYSLNITMIDYDGTIYVAVYDQFKVISNQID